MTEEDYWSDTRLRVWKRILQAAELLGSIGPDEARPVLARAYLDQGVEVNTDSWVCGQMVRRALDHLVASGDLERRRGRYEHVTWSRIAESDDHQLSSTGKVRASRTRRLLRVREDSRGRELVDLNGRTFDVSKLTRTSGQGARSGA